MAKITEEEKSKIVMEELEKFPLETIGHVAMLKLAEFGININSKNVKTSSEATFKDVRYEVKMKVTYKKL